MHSSALFSGTQDNNWGKTTTVCSSNNWTIWQRGASPLQEPLRKTSVSNECKGNQNLCYNTMCPCVILGTPRVGGLLITLLSLRLMGTDESELHSRIQSHTSFTKPSFDTLSWTLQFLHYSILHLYTEMKPLPSLWSRVCYRQN